VAADRRTWIDRYAQALGVAPPSEDDVEALLALAGAAAHASERTAAPLSCWLAALAGVPAREALRVAEELSAELTGST
jgi:hypothetical protein